MNLANTLHFNTQMPLETPLISFATVLLSKKLERIDELFVKNFLFLVKPFKTYRYNINLKIL